MQRVVKEYEVSTRAQGCTLVNALQRAGYAVKQMLASRKTAQPLPANSFYQLWDDGTVTWDVIPLDMPEAQGDGYSLLQFDSNTIIEPYEQFETENA